MEELLINNMRLGSIITISILAVGATTEGILKFFNKNNAANVVAKVTKVIFGVACTIFIIKFIPIIKGIDEFTKIIM